MAYTGRNGSRRPSRVTLAPLLPFFALLLVIFPAVSAVKRHDFKTCQQSGFCRRNRAFADRATEGGVSWKSPYEVVDPSFSQGRFTARLANALFPNVQFSFEVRLHKDGVARVIMDEVDGLRQRYNEASKWALEKEPVVEMQDSAYQVDITVERTSVKYANGRHELRIEHKPVSVTFLRDGQPHVVLNERGLLNMEHFRIKAVGEEHSELVAQDPENPNESSVAEKPEDLFPGFLPPDEDGMWDEGFQGKRDSKPKGPESLSLDITFPGYEHVYGIPEHASSLSLKQTRGGDGAYTDPYRLYNLDVFEYDVDSEMALYGSVPFMQAHRAGSTVGVFLVNAAETWVDVTKSATSKAVTSLYKKAKKAKAGEDGDAGPSSATTSTHWISESGILDLFVFLGPSPLEVINQYTSLAGRPPLPQYFALGYHQCRWNYNDERDVQEVQEKFDEFDIPMDVMWLDIEYAEEHQYFVWDRRHFPTPEKMQEKLAERGRQLVAIVDPHIKRSKDLYVYKEAQDLDILCKKEDGKTEYEGHCWTGSSAWVDWFNPKSHDWWASLFKFDKFEGSTKNLFIWNDMNEPSVFSGPEITMHKDAVHHGGWEHRDVHNINGMIYQNLTMQGLIAREDPPRRPFVLSRAYYAGSQRYGAIWTGDNIGDWPHLASTVPMLLSNNIAGIIFIGSDVGGFFGNPSPEMITRWHQIGTWSPFFRAHGHIDTKRREVYLWDEPYRSVMREAIRIRYQLLPVFYTSFYEASLTGVPVMKPQYLVFPNDPRGFALDDQFYLGSSGLLVKPVTEEGQRSQDVYISDDQPYYHYLTHDIYFGASHGGASVKVPAPLESIPVLQRGGHILPRRDIVRRSAILSWRDPITLVAAVDLSGTSATGSIYLDDGESFANEKGDFVYRRFQLEPQQAGSKKLVLRNRAFSDAQSTAIAAYDPANNGWAQKIADVVVREILILGLPSKPTCVKLAGSSVGLDFEWTDGVGATASRRSSGKAASVLKIKDANSAIVSDWDILFSFDAADTCTTTPAIDHEAALQSQHCPVGQFYCRNQGHIPSCILRSRVNDGICDPECCDGSDETDGKIDCPNRCAQVHAEYSKVKAEEARKRRVGSSIRNDYIKHGAKEKAKLEAEVEKVGKELEKLRQREAAAKLAFEEIERDAAGEIERKKDSQLFRSIVEMQAAIKALRAHRQNLEGHISDLSGIMADLSRSFNPNHQDMAVLGAVRAYKEWRTDNGLGDVETVNADGSTADDYPSHEGVHNEEAAQDFSDEDLKKLAEEDPLSLIDSLSTRLGSPIASGVANIFRLDDYIPDKFRPQYDSYKKTLLDLLTRAGLIYPPVFTEGADRPELTRAKTAHSTLVDQVRDEERKLDETRKKLEQDWGRDWEWKKLEGTCVEQNTGEYTYSVCFFGEAQQRSNSNGMKTSLGRFEGWSSEAEKGTEEYYHKQLYANGQRCWNGPLRSAKVDLVCGTSNALLSVIEPEKCEYLFKVSSPAVCFPQAEDGEQAKDEL